MLATTTLRARQASNGAAIHGVIVQQYDGEAFDALTSGVIGLVGVTTTSTPPADLSDFAWHDTHLPTGTGSESSTARQAVSAGSVTTGRQTSAKVFTAPLNGDLVAGRYLWAGNANDDEGNTLFDLSSPYLIR